MIVLLIFVLTASLVNYYRGFVSPVATNFRFSPGIIPKTNYQDLLTYMSKEFKEGDLVVTADGQAYVIGIRHVSRHAEQYQWQPSAMFCFFFYPNDLVPYLRKFLGIEGQIKEGDRNTWHHPQVCIPRADGKLEIKETQLEKRF